MLGLCLQFLALELLKPLLISWVIGVIGASLLNIWFLVLSSKNKSFLFFLFLAMLQYLQDLSSPTRDWIQATAVKAQNPNN